MGVGYDLTGDRCNDLSNGIMETAEGGDGGAPGPNGGMMVGISLVLGFGCANGPDEGAGRVQ